MINNSNNTPKSSLSKSSKKHICPNCQKKTFTYFDGFEGSDFGRCDRENSCGYFKAPGSEKPLYTPKPQQDFTKLKTLYLDAEAYAPIAQRNNSPLHSFLMSDLSISADHLRKWGLGTEGEKTVFLFQDYEGNLCNEKSGYYHSNGKREKEEESKKGFFSLSQPYKSKKPSPLRYKLPLFGEHLLCKDKSKIVCIVESEKSAIIGAWFYPDYDWVSCGSSSGLSDGNEGSNDKISPLLGRDVFWLCDADKAGRDNSSLRNLQKYGIKFTKLDVFPDLDNGFDIADACIQYAKEEREELPQIEPIFWKTQKGRGGHELKISHSRLKSFLALNGFTNVVINDSLVLCRTEGKLIKRVAYYEVKHFILDFIENYRSPIVASVKNEDTDISFTKEDLLEKFLQGITSYVGTDKLDAIPITAPEILKDTMYSSYYLYNNCFVEVTPKGVFENDYSQLPAYIWEESKLKRKFKRKKIDYQIERDRQEKPVKSEQSFMDFLLRLSKDEGKRFNSLLTHIGYMMHRFWDYDARALVITDSVLSDGPSGRSGKSLLGKAICQMLGEHSGGIEISGKDFDPNYIHKFAKASLNTSFIHLDDIKKNFDFEHLFTAITDSIEVRKLHTSGFYIKTKMMLSTNKTLRGDSDSHRARKHEFEVSNYFNAENRVDAFYRQRFFSDRDWSDKEWQEFDNLMLDALHLFFIQLEKSGGSSGVIPAEQINLKIRKLMDHTNPAFVEFAKETLKEGEELELSELFNSFLEEYPDFNNNRFRRNTFTDWLQQFCDFRGWKRLSNDLGTRRKSGNSYYLAFEKK